VSEPAALQVAIAEPEAPHIVQVKAAES